MLHTLPAYEFRRRARAAMKPIMPLLLVVAMIAALPSLINDAVVMIADANPNTLMTDFTNRLMQVVEKAGLTQNAVVGEVVIDQNQLALDILAVQESYFANLQNFITEKGPLLACLSLMVVVASPMLTLGMINALLHALRKKEFTATIAFSRARHVLKAVGLMLWVALKLLVWMLPGMALAVASLFMSADVALLALIVGFVASVVMGIMASYRYAMAVYVMADDPTTKIRACVRRSKEVMKGRRMELFGLEFSFLGWRLLLSMGQSMLLGLFGGVLGMTLGMFASLFLQTYLSMAETAFYQEYAVGPIAPAQEDEEAEELL